MVTAAKGAEQFYTVENHTSRSEGLELAQDRDTAAARVSLILRKPFTKKSCQVVNFLNERSGNFAFYTDCRRQIRSGLVRIRLGQFVGVFTNF